MAASATPRTAEPSAESLSLSVAVAYSGGRDSSALLHATSVAAAALCAQGLPLRVVGMHVHHGLSPQADAWLAHCTQQCRDWATQGLPVSLMHRRLLGRPAAGESIEAWARAGRYRALAEMALDAGASLLLLAQHRRDQAETWLLQALRGAGVAGLAGMPHEQQRDGLVWVRPWLDYPREAIEAYVAAHGLSFVEDDSNSDPRYARNRLRRSLWPALTQAFPGAEVSLAQSAAWSQQALALADELADEDLRRCCDDDGALACEALLALSLARSSNLLRAWLQRGLGHPAPASLVQRLLVELSASRSASWPAPGGRRLRLYRGWLRWSHAGAEVAPRVASLWLDLSRPGELACPQWGGRWRMRAVEQGGAPLRLLERVELRARQGGEQFQSHARGLPRSLKKCWQTAGADIDSRQGPLLFAQGQLLWVPGLGIDARLCAKAGEAQLAVEWLPSLSG